MNTSPTAVSLFAGAGGLDIGLERAGWHVRVATDKWADSMETLRRSKAARIRVSGSRRLHLGRTRLLTADIEDLRAADLCAEGPDGIVPPALLAGGPPCQPWSSAGSQKGLADPRGRAVGEYLRLVDEMKPHFLLFENVRGLLTARGRTGRPGEVLKEIQHDLTSMGYATRIATLNAADYGAAQRRVRLLLIGTRTHQLPEFPEPTHDKGGDHGRAPWVSLGNFLRTLPSPNITDIVRPTGSRAAELRSLTPGTGIKTRGQVMSNRPGGQWGYRQDSFLADLDLPSRTIRGAATPDWVRLPQETDLRRLTWGECAALQGFPAEWEFAGGTSSVFLQIGNAVHTGVGEVLGRALLEALAAGPAHEPASTPPWPPELERRIKYTLSEQKVNGHLRARPLATRSA